MKHLIILFFAAFCFGLNAQTKLSAIVLDKKNKPVKGVEIYYSEDLITTTNELGYFEFNAKFFPVIIHGYLGKDIVFGYKFTLTLTGVFILSLFTIGCIIGKKFEIYTLPLPNDVKKEINYFVGNRKKLYYRKIFSFG